MASSVVSLPLPPPSSVPGDNPAEARKRRREILASHRNNATPDASASSSSTANAVVSDGETSPPFKKRKVVATTSTDLPMVPGAKATVVTKAAGSKPKRPQMKYDPDVPMTKEEAAVWRREQRRKRNRESAAASRQRQRDRIVELEAEVDEWKTKFEAAMKRIRELEQHGQASVGEHMEENLPALPQETSPVEESITVEEPSEEGTAMNIQSPEELVEEVFRDTTILISPSQSPRSVSPTSSTVVDFSQVQAVTVVSGVGSGQLVSPKQEEQKEQAEPSKMISRPAVKIHSGSVTSVPIPLLPDADSFLCPDPCHSLTKKGTKIAPIDAKLFPRPASDDAAVMVPNPVKALMTVADDNEEEFGEFLLDAVDWL